jgi:D-alanyl-D-alanine carboxypeptidase (penicillin-binding protein 5/6)
MISRKAPAALAIAALAVLALTVPAQARLHRERPHLAARHREDVVRTRREERDAAASDDPPTTPALMAPYLTGAYPHTVSRYTALMDVNSGQLLYSANPYAHREPASLTKIMAATVLLERGKLTDTVVAPQQVVGTPESSLHLRPGERLSLEDLLYAMLLRSANDTPIAGATYLSGSIPAFVGLMNQQAQEEGCLNTHFVTPNGLYDPGHYSCAHDMALMARYAVLNLPMFDEIVKTQRYKVHRSIDTGDTLVTNTATSYLKYFPGADGIKTGYISQAGHCFVGSATRGGWRLIAVALDSPKCREDVMQMLSYGFAHFRPVVVAAANTPEGEVALPDSQASVPVATGRDLDDVVSLDHPAATPPTYTTKVKPLAADRITYPIQVGDRVGTVILYADGRPVSAVEAVATQAVAAPAPMASSMSLHGGGKVAALGRMAGAILLSLALVAFAAISALKSYARATAKNTRRRRPRLTPHMRAVD